MPRASRKFMQIRSEDDEGFKHRCIRSRCGEYHGKDQRCSAKCGNSKRRTRYLRLSIDLDQDREKPRRRNARSFSEDDMSEGEDLWPHDFKDRMDATKTNGQEAKDDKEEANGIDHETLQDVIVRAVETGKIPVEMIDGTHLTIGSITEFFDRYNEDLKKQLREDLQKTLKSGDANSGAAQQVPKIAKLPFNVMQVAFCWARSRLRKEANDEDVKKKRAAAKAQLNRARQLYQSKKAAGITNPKDIMASVCDILKAEIRTPTSEPTASQVSTSTKTNSRRDEKAIGEEQAEVQSQRTYLREECEPLPRSYDASCEDSPETSQRPGLDRWTPSVREEFERQFPVIALPTSSLPRQRGRQHEKRAATSRGKKNLRSALPIRKTCLSEAVARACIGDAHPDFCRSTSPEKKRKGTRGVALPIHQQQRKVSSNA